VELRSIDINLPSVLLNHVRDALSKIYRMIPEEVQSGLAYLPDRMILDFILVKTFPEHRSEAVGTLDKFFALARSTLCEAAYLRIAAVWSEEEELTLAALEMVQEAEGMRERQMTAALRSLEELDQDAQKEMDHLQESNPVEYQRRLVAMRTLAADRRAAENKVCRYSTTRDLLAY
jgi:hypothetical protein